MEKYLTEIFDLEMESGRLQFDTVPEYREVISQVRELFPREPDLPDELFGWMDVSNRISFIHGMRLGIKLGVWVGS